MRPGHNVLCLHWKMIRILPIALFAISGIPGLSLAGQDVPFPVRPVKVIVPFAAGGGSDSFVRIVQKVVQEEKLLPHPLVVLNVPGAGGTIGSRKAKDAESDGYTILCLHEGILTAKYAGNADFGPEAFEPIAGTGDIGILVAVSGDSPYQDLTSLMKDATDRPDEIVFSTNIGSPSHYVGLMLENLKSGAKFRYTQTGGGAKRFAALVGGHIDVTVFSLAEYSQFKGSGIRALALCAETRHPSWPEMPTAIEQGFDVVRGNTHFWWAPKGTPKDRIQYLSEVLRKAMESVDLQEKLKTMHTDPVFLAGGELANSLAKRERDIASVSGRKTGKLPDFPKLTLLAVGFLAGIVMLQNYRVSPEAKEDSEKQEYPKRPGLAVGCIALTALYLTLMQAGLAGFRTATIAYIFAVGALLAKGNWRMLPVLGMAALVLGIGLHYVFTKVLVIDLP